ncbi:MAG: hypothetical protein N2259_02860 [Patescibacteria group bacterium]|nr:hypothetical protein [Patescibacteria group bacterium]
MNNNYINLLPGEKRSREIKKEERREKVTYLITKEKEPEEKKKNSFQEKQTQRIEKKEKGRLFSFLRNVFRSQFSSKSHSQKEGQKTTTELKTVSQPEMPTSPEISLMPEKVLITQKLVRQKIIQLLIFVFLTIVIVVSLYFFTNSLLHKKINETQSLREELSLIEEKNLRFQDLLNEIKNYEERVALAEKLLKTHPRWTNFLAFLEKYTLPEISYQNLSADLSGKITLPAVAKDLSSMLKQLIIFQSADEYVEEVKFSGFTFLAPEEEKKESGPQISFQIHLILKDKVFYPSP